MQGMLWIGFITYRMDGSCEAPTTALCRFVNQLDTARRFMWNKVTRVKYPVEPASNKLPGVCRHVTVYLPIWAAFAIWYIFAHGKARLQVFALRSLQCNQIRLPLGSNLRNLSGKETHRRKALQRRNLPCRQEVSPVDLRDGDIQAAVHQRRIIPFFHKLG